MAKKSHHLVQLINPETGTKFIKKKPTVGGIQKKLRLRKYDPVLRKHCWFEERKMPSHSK